MPRRKKPKLTLIELLVLIAIGGILLAILVPAFHEAREKSRDSENLQVTAMPEDAMTPDDQGSSSGCGNLFLGFVLGVGATLLYQRTQKAKKKARKKKASATANKELDENNPTSN